MSTIEAELSKTLNISWADARDLASYARGKLGIIPGDALAEQIHRQNIVTAAIEADKQCPKKRNLPVKSGGPELRKEEKNSKDFSNPEHNASASPEAPTCNSMVDRNDKVTNKAATAEGTTTKTEKEESSCMLACASCLECLNLLGHCCALFTLC
ncbi:hypothetical protein ACHAWT_003287 [Skeletonema menzelii]